MTIMLQAGFILVLCGSFYQLTSFYANVNQVLTARNHAERVISFVDDKIRHAGLGLWGCETSDSIREGFNNNVYALSEQGAKAYQLPISLREHDNVLDASIFTHMYEPPKKSDEQKNGDVLTLLYAQRNLDENIILMTAEAQTFSGSGQKTIELLDMDSVSSLGLNGTIGDIKNYAVAEAVGIPMYLSKYVTTAEKTKKLNFTIYSSKEIVIPAASELMYVKFMQMFVRDRNDGEGPQFAFRELNGDVWDNTYNQEKGILDIYMELDKDESNGYKNPTFTLYVLASGGENQEVTNPCPESWPGTWKDEYSHHIVYVSRASWKLNNLEGFKW